MNVGIIILKDESTRLPGKNRAMLCGRPLYDFLLHTIRNCRSYDAFYVCTGSQFFKEVADSYDVPVLSQPPEFLAGNHMLGKQLAWAAEQTGADVVVELTICHPFIRAESLDRLANVLSDDPTLDSSYTACREEGYIWCGEKPVNFDPSAPYVGTQYAEPVWHEANHYAVRRGWITANKLHHGERSARVEVSSIEAMDVHYSEDLRILEGVYKSGVVDWV